MKCLSICRFRLIAFSLSTILLFSDHSAVSQAGGVPLSFPTTWYSVVDRGDWSDRATWNTASDGSGSSGVPTTLDDVIIQAGDVVETDNNDLEVSSMTLEGVLEDDDIYTGHNWGDLTGSGTMVVRETLPIYSILSSFFNTGTVEYSGTGDYALPSSPTQYYNLSFRGSGTRTISSNLTVANNLRIEGGAVIAAGSYNLTVQGNWYNTTGTTGFVSTGAVAFSNVSSAQTIEGTTTFHHLTVSKGTETLTISDDITLTGDLSINSGTMDNGETTLAIAGQWTNNGTYQGLGTVVFNGTGVTHTVSGSSSTTFGSLEVDGLGSTFLYNDLTAILFNLTVTRGTFTRLSGLSLPLNVPGDLEIGSLGLLDATRLSTLTVNGNWANDGTFTAGLQNVVFGGSTTQTLTGETYFYGLEKTNGGTLVLGDDCSVTGTLTLTEGYIQTSETSILELGAVAGVSGGADNSYVVGPLLHIANVGSITLLSSTKVFPFGSNGKYRPITLSVGLLGALATVTYQGELHEGPPSTRNLPGTVHHISQQRYYQISQLTVLPTIFTVEATVNVAYNADDVVDTPTELRLVKSDGAGNWLDIGGAGSGVVGDITSGTFATFSDFVLSSSTENNPLPVELLSLTAQPQGQSVYLRWNTASETDNSHFVVERASDGKHFVPITTIAGAGTIEQVQRYEAWDQQPLFGKAYYRLRQIDFDGEYALSRPVSVDFLASARANVRIYPNPANKKTAVVVRGLPTGEDVQIQLISPGGRALQTFNARVTEASPLSVNLSTVSHCPPGVYTIVVRSGSFYEAERLLIE